MKSAVISATGRYLPEKIVTNSDLEKILDTSDEWIKQRSGIRQRRQVEEGVGPSDLALEASRVALKRARLQAEELDLIIVATLSPDYYFPGTSAFLQDKLTEKTIPAMDVRCQCSGFLYGLNTAKAFIEAGIYRRILVCGTEVHSAAVNYSTSGRDIAVLFGDGAGAVIVEAGEGDSSGRLLGLKLHTEGKYRDKLKIQFPSTLIRPFINEEIVKQELMFPYMEGRFVFKHAVTRMVEVVRELLAEQQVTVGEVDHFIFHQANLRINEMVMHELGEPMEKSFNNIEFYGNCSAASIPICLDECVEQERFRKGDLICLGAFGAGFTWGSALIRW